MTNQVTDIAAVLAKLAALEASNKALEQRAMDAEAKAKAGVRKLTLKVSEKGGLSLYGMGRFPVTLYRGQWERLLAASDDITAFIAANTALLTTKD